MDIYLVLIILLTIVLMAAGWVNLPTAKLRWLFIIAVLLIASYEFVPTPDTWEVGIYLWIRHLPTYIGEVVLYRFFVVFGKTYFKETEEDMRKPITPSFVLAPLAIPAALGVLGSSTGLFNIATEQGLPHILALPLFVLILGLVNIRFGLVESEYKSVLNWFIAGLCLWVMIHLSEFILESQKLGGVFVGTHVEQIEKIWLTLGIAAFIVGLRKLSQIRLKG